MPKSIIKTKISTLNFLIVFIGISLAALGLVYLITQGIHRRFDLVAFTFELALAIFIIYAIRDIFLIDTVHIYEESIRIKRPWKKSPIILHKADIGSYYESHKLTLFTTSGPIKLNLNKTYISNYNEIKTLITKDLIIEQRHKDRNFILLIILGFIASICFIGAYSNYKNYRKDLKGTDLATINGKLMDQKTKRGNNKTQYKNFSLTLSHLPEFSFRLHDLDNFNWQAFNQDINKQDSITIFISQEDYETKIAKTKEIGFIESGVNYSIIKLYGIKKKEKWYYIDKVDTNYKHNENFQLALMCLSIGILFLCIFVSVLGHKNNNWKFYFKKGEKRKKKLR